MAGRVCLPLAEVWDSTPKRRFSQAGRTAIFPADFATLPRPFARCPSISLQVRLEFPSTQIHPVDATCLLTGVLNTPAYGGGIRLAPDALIDDALLHVALVEDLKILQVLKLLPRLMRSGELRTSRIRRWKAQSVKISTHRPCLFHGDGEILGPTPVEIEVVPKAVRVLAPLAES